ncbi:MAG: metallopeptidase TldD-related protein [Candidatus Woesearchaeota archaeon]
MNVDSALKALNREFDEVFITRSVNSCDDYVLTKKEVLHSYSVEYYVRVLNFSNNQIKQKILVTNDLDNLFQKLKNVEFSKISGVWDTTNSVKKTEKNISKSLKNKVDELKNEFLPYLKKNKKLKNFEIRYYDYSSEIFHENATYKYVANNLELTYDLVFKEAINSFFRSFTFLKIDSIIKKFEKDLKEVEIMAKKRKIDLEKVKYVKFSPNFVSMLMKYFFFDALTDVQIHKNLSFYKKDLEFDRSLHIFDEPYRYMNSMGYDFELTKIKKHNLLYKGKCSPLLTKFYYHSIQEKFGLREKLYGHYLLGTYPRNIFMQSLPRKKDFYKFYNPRNLMEENTLVVDDVLGFHTANLKTGDFSLVVDKGYFENTYTSGQIVGGNIVNLLKNLIISKESEVMSDVKANALIFERDKLNLVQD